MSRRFRPRGLLLLIPVLMASTPPSVLALVTNAIDLEAPASAQVGVPISVTVTAKDLSGVSTGYTGTIQFTTTAPNTDLPANYTFTPNDAGTKTFSITFKSKGSYELKVLDTGNTQLMDKIANLEVQAGPPVRFVMDLPTDVTAGVPIKFKVTPVDADNNPAPYAGRVHFTTTVPEAALPMDTPNDAPLPPEFTVTFFTASPESRDFQVTDVSSGHNLVGLSHVVVHPARADKVELTPSPDDQVPACGLVTIALTPKDAYGNTADESILGARLCKTQGSASFVSSSPKTFIPSSSGECVDGVLTGRTEVIWKDMVEEDVEFKFAGANTDNPLVIHWKAGLPSFATSTFKFLETSQLRPELRTYTGALTLELARRDLCGNLLPLPSGSRLTFDGDPPLVLDNPPVEVEPGRWTTSVRLPECPANPSEPLALWPLIDDKQVTLPDGTPAERFVLPQCLPPIVQVQLLAAEEKRFAAPGTRVEFEVQVSNSGDDSISDGVLMLSGDGLTSLMPSIDGKPLPPRGEGFALPELRKDAPLTVKITAQTTAQPDRPMEALVWCADANGAPLTEKQPVSFAPQDAGVDVGCGCHAAALPSQLFPWLALLLAASRPWERLRRLRRVERNDL